MFFIYYPHRCLVEELPTGGNDREIVISMLSEEMKIPLLRYRSGDFGKVFSYNDVINVMTSNGIAIQPDLKLPFIAISGRGKCLHTKEGDLYPEAVKEAIYAQANIAVLLTGSFRLSENNDGALLEFQLRKGKEIFTGATEQFIEHLKTYSKIVPRVVFHSFYSFPYGMEIDWERKFQYL